MRTLAIDLGTRRVGLALSDEGGKFATPLDVLQITAPTQAIDQILPILQREAVQKIVLGLPINMDDSLGPAAQATIQWAKLLRERSTVEIVFVDERLSSFEAEQGLNARRAAGEKLTRKRKKEQLDAVAAAGFLQAYLDGKLPPIKPA